MMILRSALFNCLFFLYTGYTVLRLAPLLYFRGLNVKPAVIRWAGGVSWLLEHVAGITFTLRGLENLPDGAALIASKHQSAWDTMMFHRFVRQSIYVTKQEVTRIPFYGAVARGIGSISIDRKGGASALKSMVRDCRAALESGHQVIIFPEGTRVAPGSRLPYQAGVAALYNQLGFPVVPVALNSGLFWGRRSFIKHPGRIIVEFLTPIPPGLARKVFLAELEERIESATARLINEAQDNPSPDIPPETPLNSGD